jgi:dolichol kinase
MKTSFKRMPRTIGYHFQILTKGFIKMLWGTITAALIGFAIYGYVMVPSEGGYAAVSDFLVSTLIMCVAVGGMYLMGGNGNKGAKK